MVQINCVSTYPYSYNTTNPVWKYFNFVLIINNYFKYINPNTYITLIIHYYLFIF